MKRILSILVISFVLTTSSCNMLIKVPFGGPKLIPIETFSIHEAAQKSANITAAALALAPSNGSLNLAGGAKELADGTIDYNVAYWKPTVVVEGSTLHIEQKMPDNVVASTPTGALNQWDLNLGEGLTSIAVSCPAGNYTLNFADTLPDGVSISVSAGAGNLRLVFPVEATVKVEVHRGPANISTEGSWTTSGKIYSSGDSGPAWVVKVDIGVGNLTLAAR